MIPGTRTKYIYLILILIFFLVIAIRGIIKNSNKKEKDIATQIVLDDKPNMTKHREARDLGPFVEKYAGTYFIKVAGDNSGVDEILILNSNGDCTWGYAGQFKYGTWTVDNGLIKTVVKGNSGNIPEDFEFRNDKFVSKDSDTRYLKKQRR